MLSPAGPTQAILDTVLNHLALLFLPGAQGDLDSARLAASQMLDAYDIQTTEELCLAAEVISFGLHALESLGQAAAFELPLNKVLRLRSGAVSLSREAHKSQRKLDQLRRIRQTDAQHQAAETEHTEPGNPVEHPGPQPVADLNGPKIEIPPDVIEAQQTPRAVDRRNNNSGSQSLPKREMAQRMTDRLQRNQAEYVAQAAWADAALAAAMAEWQPT